MKKVIPTLALALFMFGSAASVYAKPNAQEDLTQEAKLCEADARKIALARVPGEVQSAELEREHHRIVYSYDIKQTGKAGVTEVQVDAKSGAIVSVKHESAAQEKKEREHGK